MLESPEHIKNECELMTSAAGMDPEYIEFWTEHKGEAGVISAIAKAAEKVRADLLLVGGLVPAVQHSVCKPFCA